MQFPDLMPVSFVPVVVQQLVWGAEVPSWTLALLVLQCTTENVFRYRIHFPRGMISIDSLTRILFSTFSERDSP